jgi:glutamate dehydrogenase (NAD(P)+)
MSNTDTDRMDPARDPYLQVIWTDAQTGARGYVVIDTLIHGVSAGGLRMRPGCTLEEVADLARVMTLKDAIAYKPGSLHRPFGGSKGGVDFDPLDERAEAVLERFLQAMKPLLESCWATGEDLGVRQADLDRIAQRIGLASTIECALFEARDGAQAARQRLAAGFAARERGISLGDLVGGYGVARCAIAALKAQGGDPQEATAVVQGFGSMGGASARYLADAGVRVVAIADLEGVVFDERGLPVERLLASRDRHGRIDRATLGQEASTAPRESWASIPCEILVPAAVSYAIDAQVAAAVAAQVICEAANAAVTPDAEAALAARGVRVVPDFIANMATNAWWWWVMCGEIEPTCEAAFAKIDEIMDELVDEALDRTPQQRPLREAAVQMAWERAALAQGPEPAPAA